MSIEGLVTPEPETGDGGSGGCAVAELYGQVIIVHECRNQQGVFYKIISDGPVEVVAPEVRITGKLVLQGDMEITGNVRHHGNLEHDGDTRHNGSVDVDGDVRVDGEVRARDGCFNDPTLQF